MQLLAQEEYGLRCLIELAQHPQGKPLTSLEIARAVGLSAEYAAKLLRQLRLGGLVASTRGAAGGYRLTRPPDRICVWDAIQVLGDSLFPECFCDAYAGQRPDCVRRRDCSLRALWRAVDQAVRDLLVGITLADLARGESEMTAWLGAAADDDTSRSATGGLHGAGH